MLEKLPDAIGHALRDQRAGIEQTAFRRYDLRGGLAAIHVTSLAFVDHGPIPAIYTADGDGRSPPLAWSGVPDAASRRPRRAGAPSSPTRLGRNSFLGSGWLPPDPPPGHGVHRYLFQVFALTAGTDFDGTPGREAVLDAIEARGIASGCLIGTYERPDTTISLKDAVPAFTGAAPA